MACTQLSHASFAPGACRTRPVPPWRQAPPSRRRCSPRPRAAVPASGARFPDGAAFRIEIPSVEGPRVLETVIRAAEDENVIVNRVSQGSGAMLLRTSELVEMAELGRGSGIEVSLFVGPREG